MIRTRAGYAGGSKPNPTYRKVCNDESFGDWVEAVQVEFDSARISYADLLDAFFRAHDSERTGKSRQYESVLFLHDAEQQDAAYAAVSQRPSAHTKLEVAEAFYDAEPYHQKWLLQRKRDLFLTLGMTDPAELLEAPATALNAYAAGKLRADATAERLAVHGVTDEVIEALFSLPRY